VALGSLSLRRSPCIRNHCRLCQTGEGHQSYALYGRKGKRRFVIYVPDELAPEVERAVRNGRRLQELLAEAGQRYTLALKYERQSGRKSRRCRVDLSAVFGVLSEEAFVSWASRLSRARVA